MLRHLCYQAVGCVSAGITCSRSILVSVLHRNTQLVASPSWSLCKASCTSTAALCFNPTKENAAPILLAASLMEVENPHAKPCCLELHFSSLHVLSRQVARTNICIDGESEVLTPLSKAAAWSFAPIWPSSCREAASFCSSVLFMQLYEGIVQPYKQKAELVFSLLSL